jgi:hypothetical protein
VKKLLAGGLLVVALFIASCGKFPVTDEVRIEFADDGKSVDVTADTRFQLEAANDETRRRIEAARAAAQQGTDPWSLRLSHLTPESERVTWSRTRGALEGVTHSVRISDDDLQTVFADTNITVNVLHGDGWRELRFYPGTSARASREQQRRFASELSSWSTIVARYFAAIHRMYGYMDASPGRARYLFAAVMHEDREDGSPAIVAEEEQAYVDDVVNAMDEIAKRMDEQEGRATTFAEDADLVFNPFPARITVTVPGDILAAEGFPPGGKDRSLAIEPVDLFASIAALEGKWIAPDPLAAMLREQPPRSDEIAGMPRRSTALVPADDVARAIREQLARPKSYAVRWRE